MSYIPFPAGITFPFAGATAPSGWLLCDGSAVSRTTYAQLFATIGTTFGVGDGATTFNVPDVRGRAPIGAGQGSGLTNRTLGGTTGAETVALAAAEMPVHNHGVTDPGHFHAVSQQTTTEPGGPGFTFFPLADANGTNNTRATDSKVTNITIQNAGSGSAHNNMPPSVVLNYIIKT
jgi:microcystin-dependent protein